MMYRFCVLLKIVSLESFWARLALKTARYIPSHHGRQRTASWTKCSSFYSPCQGNQVCLSWQQSHKGSDSHSEVPTPLTWVVLQKQLSLSWNLPGDVRAMLASLRTWFLVRVPVEGLNQYRAESTPSHRVYSIESSVADVLARSLAHFAPRDSKDITRAVSEKSTVITMLYSTAVVVSCCCLFAQQHAPSSNTTTSSGRVLASWWSWFITNNSSSVRLRRLVSPSQQQYNKPRNYPPTGNDAFQQRRRLHH